MSASAARCRRFAREHVIGDAEHGKLGENDLHALLSPAVYDSEYIILRRLYASGKGGSAGRRTLREHERRDPWPGQPSHEGGQAKSLDGEAAIPRQWALRTYTSKTDVRFQHLRRLMEDEWTPQLISLLGLHSSDLPMIWVADFMRGPPTDARAETYVLVEINVSSAFLLPDEAPTEIARTAASQLRAMP